VPPTKPGITRDHVTAEQRAAYERTWRRLLAPVPDDAVEQPEPKHQNDHEEAAEAAT
jgi:hypothetical protein